MSILKYVITFLYNIEKHQSNILTLILYYIPLKKDTFFTEIWTQKVDLWKIYISQCRNQLLQTSSNLYNIFCNSCNHMTTTMEKLVSSILASKFDIIGMIFISSMGIKIDVCPTYLVPQEVKPQNKNNYFQKLF